MQESTVPPVVEADPEANVTDILEDRVRATPDLAIFAVPTADGGWQDITATQFRDRVKRVAKGLIASGIEPGDRIGFMSTTRYEWTLTDFAIWYAGAVMVPIYETSSPAQLEWNLSDSEAVGLIVEKAEHLERFSRAKDQLPNVTKVWNFEDDALAALEAAGEEVSDETLEERRSKAVGSDVGTLIYTSGSSGKPKGCILTHENFVELARNVQISVSEVARPGSSTLLFITLAHVFARYISVLGVQGGVKVGHQADLTKLLPSLETFKPTFLLAVPRVFEKVYNGSEQKAEAGGKGKIFRAAAHTAVAYSKAQDAGRVPLGLQLKFKVLDKLVLSKLRAALGGRATYAISGSAPLGEYLGHFYRSLGLQILEGYGLTESTAPATVNLPSHFKIGTVGPACPGVSVRIADDGEIWLKGKSIFPGYWKNEEATAEAFDGDWFKTGDVGTLDEDGYLKITGRKKEILVTAGGKNVAPTVLEDAIRSHPLVSQVVAVGDRRPFIGALITLDADMLPTWLGNNGLDASIGVQEAAKLPEVQAALQTAIDRANEQVSRAESVRKYVVLPEDFTEASGHLTPKMSIKRYAIMRDFEGVVNDLYSDDTPKTQGISVTG